eukprot:TRINITY_DN14486_c0_g1_i1.p1 TRINITY_DN14486_c0_g1~~TRINITY_DN14486_c0_g1_i1.p1  ORF type:complete len:165 (+),score=11.80 TRINITY_DN14486_c0_g1_i1:62-556(+)
MRRSRGIRLGRKVVRFFKWVFKSKRKSSGYLRLNPSYGRGKTMTKICNWGRGFKRILGCSSNESSGYTSVGQIMYENAESLSVPKGHLAVYVGQKDDDPHRFLVPVIYFNHPLFGELLREAEQEYGYNHPGGITLPCRISDFERVQMRIDAGASRRKLVRRHRR